jgi:hypothetical protein
MTNERGRVVAVLMLLALLLPSPEADPASGAAPGDGLGLRPGPPPPRVGSSPVTPLPIGWPGISFGAGGGALAIGVLAAKASPRRSPRRKEGDGESSEVAPHPPYVNPELTFVFVSGHGSEAVGTFETLQELMRVEPANVAAFNWEWTAVASHVEATKQTEVDEAAHALEAFIGGLARHGGSIYLVGHSKGAVTITQMLAWWDAYPSRVQSSVVGAALLDPPISGGPLGILQTLGHHLGLASDGKFGPMQCLAGECRDRREHLGVGSGVSVFVVRNPDAVVTNFHDNPEGLRVYDLDDGGGSATDRILGLDNPLPRVSEAHSSPLVAPVVAECIVAESWRLGSCEWPKPSRPPVVRTRRRARRPFLGFGGASNHSVR